MSFSKLGCTALQPVSLGRAAFLLQDVSETQHSMIPRKHNALHNQLLLCSLAIPQPDLVTFKDDLFGSKSKAWPPLKLTALRTLFARGVSGAPKNDMPTIKHLLSSARTGPRDLPTASLETPWRRFALESGPTQVQTLYGPCAGCLISSSPT